MPNNIRARYIVSPPTIEKVTKRICRYETGEDGMKRLVTEDVEVEQEMFMVHFPKGHSIRVDRKELEAQGWHMRPRQVDMDTGDVVDAGGVLYDFIHEAPKSGGRSRAATA